MPDSSSCSLFTLLICGSYDFFEHESEVTPTVQGMVPRFNKVSQYIVKTNDQFIEYLHRGFITLEFYRTVGTSYEVGVWVALSYLGNLFSTLL